MASGSSSQRFDTVGGEAGPDSGVEVRIGRSSPPSSQRDSLPQPTAQSPVPLPPVRTPGAAAGNFRVSNSGNALDGADGVAARPRPTRLDPMPAHATTRVTYLGEPSPSLAGSRTPGAGGAAASSEGKVASAKPSGRRVAPEAAAGAAGAGIGAGDAESASRLPGQVGSGGAAWAEPGSARPDSHWDPANADAGAGSAALKGDAMLQSKPEGSETQTDRRRTPRSKRCRCCRNCTLWCRQTRRRLCDKKRRSFTCSVVFRIAILMLLSSIIIPSLLPVLTSQRVDTWVSLKADEPLAIQIEGSGGCNIFFGDTRLLPNLGLAREVLRPFRPLRYPPPGSTGYGDIHVGVSKARTESSEESLFEIGASLSDQPDHYDDVTHYTSNNSVTIRHSPDGGAHASDTYVGCRNADFDCRPCYILVLGNTYTGIYSEDNPQPFPNITIHVNSAARTSIDAMALPGNRLDLGAASLAVRTAHDLGRTDIRFTKLTAGGLDIEAGRGTVAIDELQLSPGSSSAVHSAGGDVALMINQTAEVSWSHPTSAICMSAPSVQKVSESCTWTSSSQASAVSSMTSFDVDDAEDDVTVTGISNSTETHLSCSGVAVLCEPYDEYGGRFDEYHECALDGSEIYLNISATLGGALYVTGFQHDPTTINRTDAELPLIGPPFLSEAERDVFLSDPNRAGAFAFGGATDPTSVGTVWFSPSNELGFNSDTEAAIARARTFIDEAPHATFVVTAHFESAQGRGVRALNAIQAANEYIVEAARASGSEAEYNDTAGGLGAWMYATSREILTFDPALLATVSGTILRPRSLHIRASLSPGICPYVGSKMSGRNAADLTEALETAFSSQATESLAFRGIRDPDRWYGNGAEGTTTLILSDDETAEFAHDEDDSVALKELQLGSDPPLIMALLFSILLAIMIGCISMCACVEGLAYLNRHYHKRDVLQNKYAKLKDQTSSQAYVTGANAVKARLRRRGKTIRTSASSKTKSTRKRTRHTREEREAARVERKLERETRRKLKSGEGCSCCIKTSAWCGRTGRRCRRNMRVCLSAKPRKHLGRRGARRSREASSSDSEWSGDDAATTRRQRNPLNPIHRLWSAIRRIKELPNYFDLPPLALDAVQRASSNSMSTYLARLETRQRVIEKEKRKLKKQRDQRSSDATGSLGLARDGSTSSLTSIETASSVRTQATRQSTVGRRTKKRKAGDGVEWKGPGRNTCMTLLKRLWYGSSYGVPPAPTAKTKKQMMMLSEVRESYEVFCFNRGLPTVTIDAETQGELFARHGLAIETIVTKAWAGVRLQNARERVQGKAMQNRLPNEQVFSWFVRTRCTITGLPVDYISQDLLWTLYTEFCSDWGLHKPTPVPLRVFEEAGMTSAQTKETAILSRRADYLVPPEVDVAAIVVEPSILKLIVWETSKVATQLVGLILPAGCIAVLALWTESEFSFVNARPVMLVMTLHTIVFEPWAMVDVHVQLNTLVLLWFAVIVFIVGFVELMLYQTDRSILESPSPTSELHKPDTGAQVETLALPTGQPDLTQEVSTDLVAARQRARTGLAGTASRRLKWADTATDAVGTAKIAHEKEVRALHERQLAVIARHARRVERMRIPGIVKIASNAYTSLRFALHMVFVSCLVLIFGMLIGYLVMIAVWMLLGTILSPEEYMPAATAVIVTTSYGIARAASLWKARGSMTAKIRQIVNEKLKELLDETLESVGLEGFASSASGTDLSRMLKQNGLRGLASQQGATLMLQTIQQSSIGDKMTDAGLPVTEMAGLATGDRSSIEAFAQRTGVNPTVLVALIAKMRGDDEAFNAAVAELASMPGINIEPKLIGAIVAVAKPQTSLSRRVAVREACNAFTEALLSNAFDAIARETGIASPGEVRLDASVVETLVSFASGTGSSSGARAQGEMLAALLPAIQQYDTRVYAVANLLALQLKGEEAELHEALGDLCDQIGVPRQVVTVAAAASRGASQADGAAARDAVHEFARAVGIPYKLVVDVALVCMGGNVADAARAELPSGIASLVEVQLEKADLASGYDAKLFASTLEALFALGRRDVNPFQRADTMSIDPALAKAVYALGVGGQNNHHSFALFVLDFLPWFAQRTHADRDMLVVVVLLARRQMSRRLGTIDLFSDSVATRISARFGDGTHGPLFRAVALMLGGNDEGEVRLGIEALATFGHPFRERAYVDACVRAACIGRGFENAVENFTAADQRILQTATAVGASTGKPDALQLRLLAAEVSEKDDDQVRTEWQLFNLDVYPARLLNEWLGDVDSVGGAGADAVFDAASAVVPPTAETLAALQKFGSLAHIYDIRSSESSSGANRQRLAVRRTSGPLGVSSTISTALFEMAVFAPDDPEARYSMMQPQLEVIGVSSREAAGAVSFGRQYMQNEERLHQASAAARSLCDRLGVPRPLFACLWGDSAERGDAAAVAMTSLWELGARMIIAAPPDSYDTRVKRALGAFVRLAREVTMLDEDVVEEYPLEPEVRAIVKEMAFVDEQEVLLDVLPTSVVLPIEATADPEAVRVASAEHVKWLRRQRFSTLEGYGYMCLGRYAEYIGEGIDCDNAFVGRLHDCITDRTKRKYRKMQRDGRNRLDRPAARASAHKARLKQQQSFRNVSASLMALAAGITPREARSTIVKREKRRLAASSGAVVVDDSDSQSDESDEDESEARALGVSMTKLAAASAAGSGAANRVPGRSEAASSVAWSVLSKRLGVPRGLLAAFVACNQLTETASFRNPAVHLDSHDVAMAVAPTDDHGDQLAASLLSLVMASNKRKGRGEQQLSKSLLEALLSVGRGKLQGIENIAPDIGMKTDDAEALVLISASHTPETVELLCASAPVRRILRLAGEDPAAALSLLLLSKHATDEVHAICSGLANVDLDAELLNSLLWCVHRSGNWTVLDRAARPLADRLPLRLNSIHAVVALAAGNVVPVLRFWKDDVPLLGGSHRYVGRYAAVVQLATQQPLRAPSARVPLDESRVGLFNVLQSGLGCGSQLRMVIDLGRAALEKTREPKERVAQLLFGSSQKPTQRELLAVDRMIEYLQSTGTEGADETKEAERTRGGADAPLIPRGSDVLDDDEKSYAASVASSVFSLDGGSVQSSSSSDDDSLFSDDSHSDAASVLSGRSIASNGSLDETRISRIESYHSGATADGDKSAIEAEVEHFLPAFAMYRTRGRSLASPDAPAEELVTAWVDAMNKEESRRRKAAGDEELAEDLPAASPDFEVTSAGGAGAATPAVTIEGFDAREMSVELVKSLFLLSSGNEGGLRDVCKALQIREDAVRSVMHVVQGTLPATEDELDDTTKTFLKQMLQDSVKDSTLYELMQSIRFCSLLGRRDLRAFDKGVTPVRVVLDLGGDFETLRALMAVAMLEADQLDDRAFGSPLATLQSKIGVPHDVETMHSLLVIADARSSVEHAEAALDDLAPSMSIDPELARGFVLPHLRDATVSSIEASMLRFANELEIAPRLVSALLIAVSLDPTDRLADPSRNVEAVKEVALVLPPPKPEGNQAYGVVERKGMTRAQFRSARRLAAAAEYRALARALARYVGVGEVISPESKLREAALALSAKLQLPYLKLDGHSTDIAFLLRRMVTPCNSDQSRRLSFDLAQVMNIDVDDFGPVRAIASLLALRSVQSSELDFSENNLQASQLRADAFDILSIEVQELEYYLCEKPKTPICPRNFLYLAFGVLTGHRRMTLSAVASLYDDEVAQRALRGCTGDSEGVSVVFDADALQIPQLFMALNAGPGHVLRYLNSDVGRRSFNVLLQRLSIPTKSTASAVLSGAIDMLTLVLDGSVDNLIDFGLDALGKVPGVDFEVLRELLLVVTGRVAANFNFPALAPALCKFTVNLVKDMVHELNEQLDGIVDSSGAEAVAARARLAVYDIIESIASEAAMVAVLHGASGRLAGFGEVKALLRAGLDAAAASASAAAAGLKGIDGSDVRGAAAAAGSALTAAGETGLGAAAGLDAEKVLKIGLGVLKCLYKHAKGSFPSNEDLSEFVDAFVEILVPELDAALSDITDEAVASRMQLQRRVSKLIAGLLGLLRGGSADWSPLAEAFSVPPEVATGFVALTNGDMEQLAGLANKLGVFDGEKVAVAVSLARRALGALGGPEAAFSKPIADSGAGGEVGQAADGGADGGGAGGAGTAEASKAEMSPEELFNLLDADKSELLDFDEFRNALKYYGIVLSEHKTLELFTQADADGEGMLNMAEFAVAVEMLKDSATGDTLVMLGLSHETLAFAFTISLLMIVLVFAFLLSGVVAFAPGGAFGATINSALGALAGIGMGQTGGDAESATNERLTTLKEKVSKMLGNLSVSSTDAA